MARLFIAHWVGFLLIISCELSNFPLLEAQMREEPSDHAQRGAIFLSQGRWEEAITELKAALKVNSNLAEVHANLGMAYYFKGESPAAVSAFQTAIHLDRERVDAAHGLGLAWYDQGNFEEAASAFRTSSQQNPAAYYNLGNSLELQGRKNEALDSYQQYIEAAPPSPETTRLREAINNKIFPTPAGGTAQEHLRRGQSLLTNKDANGAIIEFLAALRLKPNSAETSNALGLAFRAAGNLDEASAAYQTAIRLDAKFSVAYRNLAQAFEEKGDLSAAAQGYDRYLLLTPGAADAAAIREKIAKLRGGQ